MVREFIGHESRVGALAWQFGSNASVMSSGSKDRTILNRDLRAPNSYIGCLSGHKQEVCGLKYSFDGNQLASGGNDNKLMIW